MAPDFSQRAQLDEQMDALPSYREYRKCLHQLDSVSHLVLAHRPTLAFLDEVAATHRGPLRILDVACGDGTMLRRIARWARARAVEVELTGLDLNPRAIQVAHEFPDSAPPVHYVVADVFDYQPENQPDIVLSAHFAHHLAEPDIPRFLAWMQSTARLGWFVNDLHRHPNPYRMFGMLAAIFRWDPVIASDGLISIRRAFTIEDWKRYACEADLPECTIREQFPARITVKTLRT